MKHLIGEVTEELVARAAKRVGYPTYITRQILNEVSKPFVLTSAVIESANQVYQDSYDAFGSLEALKRAIIYALDLRSVCTDDEAMIDAMIQAFDRHNGDAQASMRAALSAAISYRPAPPVEKFEIGDWVVGKKAASAGLVVSLKVSEKAPWASLDGVDFEWVNGYGSRYPGAFDGYRRATPDEIARAKKAASR